MPKHLNEDYEMVEVGRLIPAPYNPNQGDLGAIILSIKANGFYGALVVQRSTRHVLAGNHRLHAAVTLGYDRLPVTWVDVSDDAAKRILAVDNHSNRLGNDNPAALAELLTELAGTDKGLAGTGFDGDDLDALLSDLANAGDPFGGCSQGEGGETGEKGDGYGEGPVPALVFSHEEMIEAGVRDMRERGFPYRDLPRYECLRQINRLAATDGDKLLHTVAAYQVADTYHRHRFHDSAEGMKSPYDAFADDVTLRKAFHLALENNKDVETVLWIVNGTQACANFRPGFACKLYRQYCPPQATVLDTSTGYGGRLVGFVASGVGGKYIGVDPNTLTHCANERMAADLGFADRVELHNFPAEDVPHDVVAGRCDFAFTSPPYFAKEHYGDEDTQSWKRYGEGDAWRAGFLFPMMALQYAALKDGCHAVVNVADVKLRGKTWPLVRWTIEAATAAGFEYLRTDDFDLQRRVGAGMEDEVASEPILVFRKS